MLMRYIIVLLVFIAFGCSNEFELNEPKKETPVVYAIIDPADDFQYFRIERAFLDPNRSAEEVAQIADSLYYKDIIVKLIKGSSEYTLTRINGENEGKPRDPNGKFASAPNVLYKIATEQMNLQQGDKVTLSIDGIFPEKSVTAETTIIAKPGFSSIQPGGTITFIEGKKARFGWSKREGDELFGVTITINVTELNTKTNEQTPKQVIWEVAKSTKDENIAIEGVEFYQFMGGAFEANEDIRRFLGEVTFEITAGDRTLDDLNRIAGANLGITSSGEIPTYTNISDGLGIFACKHTNRTINISLSGMTKESLRNGQFTKDLNFQ